MASWGERLTRISVEITDVKRVVVVVVVGESSASFSEQISVEEERNDLSGSTRE